MSLVKNHSLSRRLQSSPLVVEMIPGEASDKTKFDFDWWLLEYKQSQIEIQLKFKDAYWIAALDNDFVQITVSDISYFVDEDGQYIQSGSVISKKLPTQIQKGTELTLVNALGILLSVFTSLIGIATLCMTYFEKHNLVNFMRLIEFLQIVSHLPLIAFAIPGNVKVFFAYLVRLSTFDFLPTTDMFDKIYGVQKQISMGTDFVAFGIESTIIVRNFGSLFVFGLILLVSLVSVKIFNQIRHPKIKQFMRKMKVKLFWNWTLIYLMISYLPISVCVLIQIYAYVYLTPKNWD